MHSLIRRCQTVEPCKRMEQCLQHTWSRGRGVDGQSLDSVHVSESIESQILRASRVECLETSMPTLRSRESRNRM